ncbi:MAG: hypothetical protein ACRD94_05340, partial [Nitrosopumilaceae archaeon]
EQENSEVFGINEVTSDTNLPEESVVAGSEEDVDSIEESVVAGSEEDVDSIEKSVVAGSEEDVDSIEESVGEENPSLINNQHGNGLTLVQALTLKEGKLNLLVRESVAAMLNAAHPDLKYPYTVPQIMTMTQIAIANENYDDTLNLLKTFNDKDNSPLCSTHDTLLTP